MKKLIIACSICLYISAPFAALAEDHDHKEGEKHTEAEEKKSSGDEKNQEEESSQIGPDSGILEANQKSGFKISPEAEKNFGIVRVKVSANGTLEIPKKAIVTTLSEVNVFRYQDGFYKRVDFQEVKRTPTGLVIKSDELKSTDEVVIRGLGFLRIAEIAAFGGAAEGHSH